MNRFKQVLSLVVVSVGLSLAASQAHATTIFQDDFEGYTATSSWPTTVPNADPGSPPVGEPWYVNEPIAAYCVQVLNVPAGTANCAGPHGGANYLQVAFGDKHQVAAAPLSAANQTLVAENKNLTLDMWVYKNSLDGYTGQVEISGFDAVPGSYTGRAFDLYFKDDGAVDYYDGAFKSTGLTCPIETWQHLTVAANFATHTYDVTIGSQAPATGLAFEDQTISKIQHLLLAGERATPTGAGYDTRGSFDDILMTTSPVPEPSTLAMLTGGLLGLLAWRKRK